MNAIAKTLKHQENSALRKFKNKSFNAIETLITQPKLIDTIKEELPIYRNRLFTPIQTLCMFISQASLHDTTGTQLAYSAQKRSKNGAFGEFKISV